MKRLLQTSLDPLLTSMLSIIMWIELKEAKYDVK